MGSGDQEGWDDEGGLLRGDHLAGPSASSSSSSAAPMARGPGYYSKQPLLPMTRSGSRTGLASRTGLPGLMAGVSPLAAWALVAVLTVFVILGVAMGNVGGGGGGGEGAAEAYGIMIDAGSSGSRVHVYRFSLPGKGRPPVLLDEVFEQLTPGLSSYADTPEKSGESLRPLMEAAVRTVPLSLRASTPIALKATAGLRMVDDPQKILDNVRAFIARYPFRLSGGSPESAVSIIDGAEEGAFGWMTVNYLLGHLGQPGDATAAITDLGGGSTQIAFAKRVVGAPAVPRKAGAGAQTTQIVGPDNVAVRFGGRDYALHVHSYLGYGLISARKGILSQGAASSSSPCLPVGFEHEFENDEGESLSVRGSGADATSFSRCTAVIEDDLIDKDFTVPIPDPAGCCDLASGRGMCLYAFSFFFDSARDVGIIGKDDYEGELTPQMYKDAAEKACAMDIEGVASAFPGVKSDFVPFLCLDLTYVHSLLTSGYKVGSTSPISLAKRITYNGVEAETSWTLGAVLATLEL